MQIDELFEIIRENSSNVKVCYEKVKEYIERQKPQEKRPVKKTREKKGD